MNHKLCYLFFFINNFMVLLHMCLTINHQKQQFTFLHLRYFDSSAIQPPSLIPPWTFIILVKASLFTIIDTALWKEYKQEHFKNTLSVYERKRSFQRGHDILCSSMYIICQPIPRRRSRGNPWQLMYNRRPMAIELID